ncbi:unnamed protein product [Caenorhabditis auriculariae]|uniref:Uncharacterized protein n=1 Tax=Caenorhabditis auriculariae TaxID=2777116 RepID=A0A8S1GQY3_9PELO|nr:unnamed protein product [Caenorhabditis auriculariae]
MSTKKKQEVDFEEEWSKVSDGVLTIKWYYFPTSISAENFRDRPEYFYNVKIDVGERFKKGFTVNNIRGFVAALRKYVDTLDIESDGN